MGHKHITRTTTERNAVATALFGAVLLTGIAWSTVADATTYRVGPNESHTTLQDVLNLLKPGDTVEVEGDAIYPGDIHFKKNGTPDEPITIRGIIKNGKPPVLKGGGEFTVIMNGNNYILDSFEITEGRDTCIIHKADNITIRNVVVHDCQNHGIMGTDDESGSLTIEHSEFYNCGSGEKRHQLYIATDQRAYPGSTFRLQFTYIHSANGGNNVKSRAERNEIYYNWIEGAGFHGLDLIGPVDDRGKARNDSDIVGNVIITTSSWQAARIGSDGHERTRGRYRFVNNTMIMGPDSTVAIRMQEEVESIELHNNVFVKLGEKEVQLVRHSDPHGPDPVIRGSNNWIQHGFVDIPDSLSNTQEGKSPEFADLDSLDLIPTETSPLVDCGTTSTVAKDSHAMPNPLKYAEFIPPNKMRLMPNTQVARSTKEIDIGAFEYGLPHAPPPDWAACHTESSSEDDSGSCFCGMAGRSSNSSTGWWVLAGLGVAVGVRRKVSPNRSGCRSESR